MPSTRTLVVSAVAAATVALTPAKHYVLELRAELLWAALVLCAAAIARLRACMVAGPVKSTRKALTAANDAAREAHVTAHDPKGEIIHDIKTIVGYAAETNTYAKAGKALSKFVKKGHLCVSDLLRANSDKLVWMHATIASLLEGGMQIRYTVQFNLFAGTVANLGNDAQREQLAQILKKGELGCFALTEKAPGVLSGLVVDTTATWQKDGSYVLHTPNEGANKVWISSGLVSRWAVVIARLFVPVGANPPNAFEAKGRARDNTPADAPVDKGPHAFLVDLQELEQAGGVTRTDMAPKTDFNGLDNAVLAFHHAKIAGSTLLQALSGVDAKTGAYTLADPNVPFRFEHVAQRLLSGRICIALAGLDTVNTTMDRVRGYDRKIITGRGATLSLAQLPAMRDLLDRGTLVAAALERYCRAVVSEYSSTAPLSPRLVKQINAAKVLVVTFAIRMTLAVKAQVGSYSLMKDSPFGSQTDILYVFQFAEGDAGILKQKVARDTLTAAKPLEIVGALATAAKVGGQAKARLTLEQQRDVSLIRLLWRMQRAGQGAKQVTTWLESHDDVEALAWGECVLTVRRKLLQCGAARSAELRAFDEYYGVV